MAISRLHVFSAGEVLLASDLNSEFNNILTGGTLVGFPLTQSVSFGGFTTYWDAGSTIGITGVANGISLTGGAFNTAQGADIASASTINLDTATGNTVDVTGTTTITAITLSAGRHRYVRFTGALTLTNGASLVLPSAATITTVAGDYALFIGYGSGVVRCASYIGATVNATTVNTTTVNTTTVNTTTVNTTTVNAIGAIKSTSPTLGIGYATGAGGAVTQITNLGTAVTLNKICGQITAVSSTYSIGSSYGFTLNNSNIAATDVVLVSTTSNQIVSVSTTHTIAGSCDIIIYAATGNTFSFTINFIVIKAVAA
jgi:hypothetical protein